MLFCAVVHAQTAPQPTNIAIETGTLQSGIKRLGINLGTLTNYDSGQMTKNLITVNPGFEGQIWNSTIRCAYGTATSCTDENQYAGWKSGFWNGATYQIFYGAAAGRTGTVTNSTAPGYGEGIILNFADSGVAPAQGDYLILHKTVPGSSSAGWSPYTAGAGTITDNLTDLPPGTSGKQTTVLTAPTQNDFANLSFFFDGTAGKTFIQLNGTYQLQFKAKGIGGYNQAYVTITRYGVATYINQVVNLTNTWQTYNLTFTASETGSEIGTVGVAFSTVGATAFELDDVSLTAVGGEASNTTHFRDPVVDALRTLQPGTLRYWGNNGHLGETLDNLLTPQFGRQMAGYSPYFSANFDYGLHDFLQLANLVGAEPWFVVPATFSLTDASNLIEYLGGSTSTPYGAKRAALGQATPWTQVFSKIHLEFGNEAWNGIFAGGNIEYPEPYGTEAQAIFGAMRANAAYVASSFDLILGGQAYLPARTGIEQSYCNNNDSFAIAPYTMNDVDSYSTNELLFGSTFAEPEALMSSTGTAEGLTPGAVYQNYQQLQSSGRTIPLDFYEMNLSTLTGAIPQASLNTYTPSLGAGLMVADTMLQAMATFGVVNQELFALPQYDYTTSSGNTVLLWGSVVDMGVTNRRRPQYLALELANQALSNGATMVPTLQTGANPTWNQPLVNTVEYPTAHYIQSYAFSQGQNLSAVLFNLSRTTALPVTFSGNAPGGTVNMQQLTSTNLTDTNENADVISITPSTLPTFNPAVGLTLPPYSMTVLTWTQQGTPAPVISVVSSGGITSTSATITWTTDQASSSLVNYGTTTGYGSSSTLNSTLSTSHSVTLNGLLPSMTYDFDVVSANSAGSSSTSSNLTFVTTAAPPVISAVTASGITATSATITWTTDEATSSLVNYGTTAGYGSASALNSALSTSHSVTLTGLSPGITYDFDVVSANSGGASSTSSNLTFVTTAQAPVISAVTASGITAASATITWTTDQATSSLVNYGTTAGYGSASAPNSALSTSHSVTLTGLSPSITYDFDVVSANSAGTSSTSANLTFTTTAAAAPVISAVTTSGIAGTTATITWTTDQATSSLVNYGTTTGYGSASTLNSTLSTSHSVTLTGLSPGITYDFDVVSANSAGTSTTSANGTFATPANIPLNIIGVASWSITPSAATVGWSTEVVSNTQLSYGTTPALGLTAPVQSTLTNSHYVSLTGLNSGTTYYYAVRSTAADGSTGTSSVYSFTTYGVAGPNISAVAVSGITTSSATITWTTDQASSGLVYYGATTSYGSSSALNSALSTSQSVTLTGLTPGTTYDFEVVSTDLAGGTSTSANLTFMTTAAGAPVISAVTVSGITGSSATISWTTDQASSSLVNYGTTTGYGSASTLNSTLSTSHSVTVTGLSPGGTYDFDVVSANSAGTSSTSANMTFSTTVAAAPVISAVTTSSITGTTATISWTTDQATSSLVNYGTTTAYGSSSGLNATLSTSHSVTLTGLSPGITYDFDVVSANSAGASSSSANNSFATPSSGSGTPLNILYVASWSITTTGATIGWSTEVISNTSVSYGTSPSLGLTTPVQSTLTNSHGVTLTGLNPGTTYYYVVQSTAANGSTGTSSVYSFTTLGAAGPVIYSVSSSGITGTSATITWTTDQATSSLVNYGTTTGYGSASALYSTLSTSHSVTLTGLSPGTTYDFAVVSANSAGTSSTSPNLAFTTVTTAAPVISAVTVSGITGVAATITWTTDQATTSLVSYGTTTGYGAYSAFNSTLSTSHSVTLTGLSPAVTYDFQVVSSNSAGTSSTSGNGTFTTTATSASGTLNIVGVAYWGITTSGATIGWSTEVNSNTSVAYGTSPSLGSTTPVQSTLTNSHGATLTGLSPGTTYYFVAQSTASDGTTGTSSVYSFTTVAVVGPVISNVVAVPEANNMAQITWTTSVPSTSFVTYGSDTNYGRWSSQTGSTTSPAPSLGYVPSGVVHYQLYSTDRYGNQTISPDYTFVEP
jgi:hypothetical protein